MVGGECGSEVRFGSESSGEGRLRLEPCDESRFWTAREVRSAVQCQAKRRPKGDTVFEDSTAYESGTERYGTLFDNFCSASSDRLEPPSVGQSAERGSERRYVASEAFVDRSICFEIEIERKVGDGRKKRHDRSSERRRHRTHRAIKRNRQHNTLPVASMGLRKQTAPHTLEVIIDRAVTDKATYNIA
jgi:hypothetical protein